MQLKFIILLPLIVFYCQKIRQSGPTYKCDKGDCCTFLGEKVHGLVPLKGV